jgi:16S rRNA (uracil1498-N3)-methyltransferase
MTRVLLSSTNIEAIEAGEEFDLEAETAKKLVRVLRLTPGEIFAGFDGRGREWECALVGIETQKKPVARAVALQEKIVEERAVRLRLSVAQAIPKGDKMEMVLQKGTELGVCEFWPFEASRSVARIFFEDDQSERAASRAERWRRIVESAAAQCGRADVPIVHAITDFSTVVSYGTNQGRCFLLDESRDALPLRETLQRTPLLIADETTADATGDDAPFHVMLLVGPEGGWTTEEREWADRYGAECVSLGHRVLRTETAALVAAAVLQWEAGGI